MRAFRLSLALAAAAVAVQAQDNYEIQVYPGQVVEKGITMVELHSNFTFEGSRPVPGTDRAEDGTAPTTHALHETVEITHGFTDWFETGLYIFTSYNQYGNGYGWVGDHIGCPAWRCRKELKWPVNLSLSLEFGYQRAKYSTDTWTLEIRPDYRQDQVGRWYLSFNPTVDRAFHGPGRHPAWCSPPTSSWGLTSRRRSTSDSNITARWETSATSILSATRNSNWCRRSI